VAGPQLGSLGLWLVSPGKWLGEAGGCPSGYGTVLAVSLGGCFGASSFEASHIGLSEHIQTMLKNTAEALDIVPVSRLSQQPIFKGKIALS